MNNTLMERLFGGKDVINNFQNIISSLNAHERQLITHRYIYQYTYEEMSQIYGITSEEVEFQLNSIINKLKLVYNNNDLG